MGSIPTFGIMEIEDIMMPDPTPTNPTTTIVAIALTNVLTDIWYEQNKHRDIDRYQEEFHKFCESVLYSALAAKENTYGK